jgi:hypothetical protein
MLLGARQYVTIAHSRTLAHTRAHALRVQRGPPVVRPAGFQVSTSLVELRVSRRQNRCQSGVSCQSAKRQSRGCARRGRTSTALEVGGTQCLLRAPPTSLAETHHTVKCGTRGCAHRVEGLATASTCTRVVSLYRRCSCDTTCPVRVALFVARAAIPLGTGGRASRHVGRGAPACGPVLAGPHR